ncbi:MAG: serine hydrolase domain-containing protein [Bacteroidota bacterium]
MKSIVFFVSIVLVTNQLHTQTTELKSFFDVYTQEHQFNGNVMIVQNKNPLFSRSYGLANQEFKTPNTLKTKFRVASITKLFTSVLIYKLVEDGKLTLDKTIADVLLNYKGDGAQKVSIHQLLTSTSGIESLESHGDEIYEKKLSSDEILEKYASGRMDTIPGTKFSYNNADYVILGKILERIHRQSFETILNEQILSPFELSNTGILDYAVVDNLATSYWWNNKLKRYERDIPYYGENYGASGNMYSTVGDLTKFSEALYSGKIIRMTSLDKLLETVEGVKDFDNYASGLWSFSFPIGNEEHHHGASRPGNIWGSECMLFRFIEKGITMVILSNGMGTSDMWEILRKVQPVLYKD